MKTKAFLRSVVMVGAWTFALAAGFASPGLAEVELRIDARPQDKPIQLHVLVENAGSTVAGLSVGDFAVTLDGQPVSSLSLTRPRSLGADVKTSVAIVTGFQFLPEVGSSSYANLIRELHAGDQVAIVSFRYRPNGEISIVYMSTMPFLEMDGGTNTAEAIRFLGISPAYYGRYFWPQTGPSPAMQAMDEFETRGATLPAGPRALIGAIARDSRVLGQLIERAIQDNIVLFNVAYAGERLDSFLAKRAGTWETGGALVVVNDESQDDLAIERIGDWLNDSYRLSIPDASVTDCGLHALELTVRGQSVVQSFARCDSHPDPFGFEFADEVEPSVSVVSQPVTITGIDSPVPVEVFDGEYSIGCGSNFTSEPGYLQPQDVVCVRHQSSDLQNDSRLTVLAVGSTWAVFESITRFFQPPPPPPPANGGGGGSTGLLEILLVLAALLGRVGLTRRASARLLAASTVLAVTPTLAATGDLDPGFADRGRLAPIADASGSAMFVASLDSGGTLLGGGGFHADGSLFNLDGMGCTYRARGWSFVTQIDEHGVLDPTFNAEALSKIEAVGMARQADGRIVGIGHEVELLSSYRCSHSFRPTVFRLNSDGSRDTTFGLDGKRGLNRLNTIRSLALDSKGRIVIAGTRWADDDDPATPGRHELAIVRLRPDGNLDQSFGVDGYYFGPEIDRKLSPYFRSRYDGSDKISLVRTGSDGLRIAAQSRGVCQLIGVTADGVPDAAFGTDGLAALSTGERVPVVCHALKADSDGRLVIAGTSRNHGFLARRLASGEPDPAFVADRAISVSMTRVTTVAIAAGGKLLAGGTGPRGAAIVRLQVNGDLDSVFGDAGRTWIDLDVESGPSPIVNDMTVKEDGTVIAAGHRASWDPPSSISQYVAPFAVRLLGDGGGSSRGILSFSRWHAAPQESDGKAILRVRRSGGSDGPASVRFHTLADLEATAHEDFVPKAGNLQWATGDRSEKTIVVDIVKGSTAPEYLESFRVVLEAGTGGAGIGRRWAKVDIQPDGWPGGQIEIVLADWEELGATEGGSSQILLRRNLYFDGPVCATLVARSGSATAGVDFRSTPTTVCWGDQEFEDDRLVELRTIQDDLAEGEEIFTVLLSNPTGGAIIGPSRSASVTIYDDD